MDEAPYESSRIAQFLVLFHVSTHRHHSGNFHIRNEQSFMVHREDTGRHNGLFPLSLIFLFFKRIHYYLRLLPFPQIALVSACLPALASHLISFPSGYIDQSGEDKYAPMAGEIDVFSGHIFLSYW